MTFRGPVSVLCFEPKLGVPSWEVIAREGEIGDGAEVSWNVRVESRFSDDGCDGS